MQFIISSSLEYILHFIHAVMKSDRKFISDLQNMNIKCVVG